VNSVRIFKYLEIKSDKFHRSYETGNNFHFQGNQTSRCLHLAGTNFGLIDGLDAENLRKLYLDHRSSLKHFDGFVFREDDQFTAEFLDFVDKSIVSGKREIERRARLVMKREDASGK